MNDFSNIRFRLLIRSISAKHSKLTVNVLRRAVRCVFQTSASAGITGDLARITEIIVRTGAVNSKVSGVPHRL